MKLYILGAEPDDGCALIHPVEGDGDWRRYNAGLVYLKEDAEAEVEQLRARIAELDEALMTKEKHLTAGQRWGRWHWVRVVGLRSFYFPFWRTVSAVRRAVTAFRSRSNLVTDDELYLVTQELECHPDGWNHPCMCAECRSCS